MNTPLRFLIADDHPAFRKGISSFLQEYFEPCAIDEVANGIEVLEKIDEAIAYDIIFMDIVMPEADGFETTKIILERSQNAKIIAMSFYEDESKILMMFNCGVKGYLNKNADKKDIIDAVENVLNGSIYLDNKRIHELLLKEFRKKPSATHELSQREKEILLLVSHGLSTKEIAGRLNLAVKTIENHRNHLLKKSGAHNAASLVLLAAKKGWI